MVRPFCCVELDKTTFAKPLPGKRVTISNSNRINGFPIPNHLAYGSFPSLSRSLPISYSAPESGRSKKEQVAVLNSLEKEIAQQTSIDPIMAEAAKVAIAKAEASATSRSAKTEARIAEAAALVVEAAGKDRDAGASYQYFPLCRVAMGLEPLSGPTVPVWLFRQAGRHLPEYMEFKAERGKNFLEILNDPADVAEVTLQPLRRYRVDAAILFSDILVVPEALGIRIEMPGGKGILVPEPLTGPEDLAKLPKVDVAATPSFIETNLGHVLKAVQMILEQMNKEGYGRRPLIGFSAAPWTLMFYMVGSSSKKNTDGGERWLKEHTAASEELLSMLTRVVIEYLSAQIRAGVHAVQVFEAMGEFISPENFRKFALPSLARIAFELRNRHPGTPLMVFPRGACYALPELQTAGYDVVTADTATDLAATAQALREEAKRAGTKVATLQGNFDPKWLRPTEGGTVDDVRREVRSMLEASGAVGPHADGPRLIANLGEGLNGKESTELVEEFVNTIHELSSKTSS
eukprot:gnl/MRDRNA2_/MRDRNA2_99254_c0_seq1.p1 gnl/MRDRNA2_/MRDRNA2_99254_c0~~gnl/MRDRNA2_/MRDRNA2_99254_c0_seq1.p1  ORF type:complete len:596 (+),score=113.17 gnl/MRDRNA2_/MRDRNA2_99254_c0_seq1:234-1790(+)